MSGGKESKTKVERTSDREMVVTRTFDAPVRIVFDAWSKPELFMRWWGPRSSGMKIVKCEMDIRVGGKYRIVFGGEGKPEMEFFGVYKVVEPLKRLVWTDEEQEGDAASTATFVEKDGKTTVTFHQLFATKEALDGMYEEGGDTFTHEQFDQLAELLPTLS